LSDSEAVLWGALDENPRSVDELVATTGLPAAAILESLLVLELRGVVRQLPGPSFARSAATH
jgi:predicted Rossmann fold nucleotide-binding protein DprA/Smf involved in DNA uptake